MAPRFILFVRQMSLILLGVLPMVDAAARPCLYRGLDQDARVINRSGEITNPYPVSLTSNDCSRLRVANGTVVVYGIGPEGAQLVAKQVSRGSLLPVADGESPASTSTAGIFNQIVVVLEGVNRTKTGSSRSAEGDYLAASLPTGRLEEPAGDLTLQLGPIADTNLGSFELFVGGKLAQRQSGPSQLIKFPQHLLKAGMQLRWKLEYSGSKYEGGFTVDPPNALDELKRHVFREIPDEADEIATKLRVASAMSAKGYTWNARELIRSALAQ